MYQINKRIEVRDEYWTGYWHGKGYTDRVISSYKRNTNYQTKIRSTRIYSLTG